MTITEKNNSVFLFVVGWLFLIFILTLVNRTRLGHVILYYSLLLIILTIVATEYANITPFLGGIQPIGQLDKNLAA